MRQTRGGQVRVRSDERKSASIRREPWRHGGDVRFSLLGKFKRVPYCSYWQINLRSRRMAGVAEELPLGRCTERLLQLDSCL